MKKHQILVIGGGTGGIMVAAQLLKANPKLDIGLIEPSDKHYYQPAWTLVGANTFNFADTVRPMKDQIPSGAIWIKDYAENIDPDQNQVTTRNGYIYTYEFLVVSPGLVVDNSLVQGLPEAIDRGVVCSNYTDPEHTWRVLKNFKGGTALFTQADTTIKCGGAPQKIMYLADDHFRRAKTRNQSEIIFASPGTIIFAVPEIRETLMKVVNRKDINLRFGHSMVKVDGEKQIAWYKVNEDALEHNHKNVPIERDGNLIGIHYDMMHLAPPQKPPEFISSSPLSTEEGWVSVDIKSMQHTKYENVFGLGDAAQLPTAKTGAAIRKQVPIVVANLLMLMQNKPITNLAYNGYSSCPLVTGYGKMALAEFDYNNKFTPDPKLKQMLIFNSAKEHWRLWMLKKYILPYLYWNKMMKGKKV